MLKFLHLTVAALLLAACSKSSLPTPSARTFEVRGIVRGAFDEAKSEISIEHETIPAFMPSMTMPFVVKDPGQARDLRTGDGVQFSLFVTDAKAWIDNVKKIDTRSLRISPPKEEARRMNVPRLKEGDTWPNFTLTDQGGWPITRADYGGAMVLVTFTFTRCELPNDCSQVARNFSEILRQTAAIPALKGRVRLLSISFDPAFDTPERLASHAGRLTQDTDTWRFASGKADETGRLTASFSVRVQPEEDTIGHSLCTALIGPDGVIRKIWRGDGWTADEAVAEITSAVSP